MYSHEDQEEDRHGSHASQAMECRKPVAKMICKGSVHAKQSQVVEPALSLEMMHWLLVSCQKHKEAVKMRSLKESIMKKNKHPVEVNVDRAEEESAVKSTKKGIVLNKKDSEVNQVYHPNVYCVGLKMSAKLLGEKPERGPREMFAAKEYEEEGVMPTKEENLGKPEKKFELVEDLEFMELMPDEFTGKNITVKAGLEKNEKFMELCTSKKTRERGGGQAGSQGAR